MFDIYQRGSRVQKVYAETHEHRAPTDDSIRIYGEMREKVIESILATGSGPLESTIQWAVFSRPEIDGWEIRGRFCLNGQEIQIHHLFRNRCFHSVPEMAEALKQDLTEAVTEAITTAVVQSALRPAMDKISSGSAKKF